MSTLVGIGSVIDQLKPDFPELSVSKVRFLEAQGLIKPVRTPAGYRRYSAADIERLRYILGAQRDQFLPLRVIKEHLDGMNRGVEPPSSGSGSVVPSGTMTTSDASHEAPTRSRVHPLVSMATPLSEADVRLSEQEILRSANLSRDVWSEAITQGLVAADSDGSYAVADLEIARALSGLLEYGLTPRHLRTIKLAAERHLSLAETAATARDPKERWQQSLAVAVLCSKLEDGIVAAELRAGSHG